MTEDIKTQVEEQIKSIVASVIGAKLIEGKWEEGHIEAFVTQILSLLTDEMAKYQKELRADYDEDIREDRVEELKGVLKMATPFTTEKDGARFIRVADVYGRIKELKEEE